MSVHQLMSSPSRLETLSWSATSEEMLSVLGRDGCLIVEGLAPPGLLDQVSEEITPYLDQVTVSRGPFWGYKTKRICSLIARSPGYRELLLNSKILPVAEAALAPFCDQIQISQTQAIQIEPGEVAQVPHSDDLAYPVRAPGVRCVVNAIWPLTDFTADNGATRVVPQSQDWPAERSPLPHEMVAAEMKRGSVLLYLGATRHNAGANLTQDSRRAVVMSYSLGWLRQSENQFLAVPQDLVRELPVKLQELLGYSVHKPNLGFVNGQDPKALLDPETDEMSGFQDYLPDSYWPALEQYREMQLRQQGFDASKK